MTTHPTFEPTEEQKRKMMFFNRVLSMQREVWYEQLNDTLYADLNLTLTDKDLAMCMLRHLDKDIAKDAEEIIKKDGSRADQVRSIAKLVKGKTVSELAEASRKAVDELYVPNYIIEEVGRLKRTKLIIYTHIPMQTAEAYIKKRIDPLYDCEGKNRAIFYGTILQHRNGILTGEVLFMPDENFRSELIKSRRKRVIDV